MGLDPKIWGPAVWKLLRCCAFKFGNNPTSREREKVILIFTVYVDALIYCDECRDHWNELMKKHPPDTRSSTTLRDWFVERRNEVNERLGAPIMVYNDVLHEYNNEEHANPQHWAIPLWEVLRRHAFEFSANPTAKERDITTRLFTSWIYSFIYCEQTARQWRTLMIANPPDTRSAAILSRWFVDRQNQMYEMNGKPIVVYEDVLSKHLAEKRQSKPPRKSSTTATSQILSLTQPSRQITPNQNMELSFEGSVAVATILIGVCILALMRSRLRPRLFKF